MKLVTPKVFFVAETISNGDGINALLEHVGAPEWETDAPSSTEAVIEIGGRLCYKSFKPGLNPNVTKVREGNRPYLGNILAQRHGSVLQHASVTLAFVDVSRVFTHEAVRHVAGTAFSQESLRYVRLTELRMYYPEAFHMPTILGLLQERYAAGGAPEQLTDADIHRLASEACERLLELFVSTGAYLEDVQRKITDLLGLDHVDGNFHLKKAVTSAMRRLAPEGLGTNILMTANHRAWRHIIEMRTSGGAEEEIRLAQYEAYKFMKAKYPNLYQDGEEVFDGKSLPINIPIIKFKNSKV